MFAPGVVQADVFTNVAETSDYAVAYELAIPLNGAFQGATSIPYTIDHSATVAPDGFDRVAYYLELTGASGTNWVYASMDAFTEVASQIGLPHDTTNPVAFQRGVSNLTVLSNVAGVKTGSFDIGQIEMWHNTYTAANATAVFAASATTNDWGDTIGGIASGYGSFQIHNPGSRQVVLAYNRWASATASNDDVGIGNSVGTHPDWTLAANTATHSSRKLVVLVRPKRFEIAFTAFPVNRQVTPRHVPTNLATVPISGSESLGGFDQAVLRILRNDAVVAPDLVQNLVYTSGTAGFSFSPQIPAELASYTFQLYLKAGSTLRLVRQSTDVTAGDVFLWYGQSNAEGIAFAGNANSYASPWIRTFGISSDSAVVTQAYSFWVEANGDGSNLAVPGNIPTGFPGGIGQWPLVVGSKIVESEGIPIAILNGARAGFSMPQLQRDDAQPDNLTDSGAITRTYNRLRYRARQAKVADKARAIFFYQGESDDNDTAQHIGGFASLKEDWQNDYPALERIFVSQLHVGCGSLVDRNQPALRDAQRLLPDIYDDVRIMSTNGLTTHTDNCHFPFVGGQETHALNSFRQARRELYGSADFPAIDPPNPAYVEIGNAAGDLLRIVMRKSGAGITVDPDALPDFRLNGSSASLLSATVTDQAIELHYDAPVTAATSLDYLAHAGSAGGWVRNSNGIGLLAFSEAVRPYDNPSPILQLIHPTGVSEVVPGSTIAISASATSPRDSISRMEILINGILLTAVNNSGLISMDWTAPASGSHLLLFRAVDSAGRVAERSVVLIAGTGGPPAGIGSGLSVWLRPEAGIIRNSSGEVTEWLDSSGNSNACSQAITSAKPSYAEQRFGVMPGVAFDGDDFLAYSAGMSTGSYTKIARVRLSNLSQQGNIISSGSSVSNVTRHALFMSGTALPRLWHRGNFATSGTPMVAEQEHILIGTYDAASNTGFLYLDGLQVGTGNPANGSNVDPSYQLGSIAGGNFLAGSIGEAMIYNRVLDSSERAQIMAYLLAKSATPQPAQRLDYSTWSALQIQPPADASPAGDANLNGIANLIEFALGFEVGGVREPLEITVSGETVQVTYSRPTNRKGVTYQLFESADLSGWTPCTDTAGSVVNGVEKRIYTRAASTPSSRFYRLLVTLEP